jgi:hypothetical protein
MMANYMMLSMTHLADMAPLHWWLLHTPLLHLPHMSIPKTHRSQNWLSPPPQTIAVVETWESRSDLIKCS